MDYGQVSLSGFLNVDAVSQNALSIFQVRTPQAAQANAPPGTLTGSVTAVAEAQEEQHPGKTMGIGSNKEGFSVFGVLNKCVTSMGRRLLRLWFTRPIIDLHALNDRQDAIQARRSCFSAS